MCLLFPLGICVARQGVLGFQACVLALHPLCLSVLECEETRPLCVMGLMLQMQCGIWNLSRCLAQEEVSCCCLWGAEWFCLLEALFQWLWVGQVPCGHFISSAVSMALWCPDCATGVGYPYPTKEVQSWLRFFSFCLFNKHHTHQHTELGDHKTQGYMCTLWD